MNENLMKNIVIIQLLIGTFMVMIDILDCILQIFFPALSTAFGCVTFATATWL